jgi:hypothetical protein
VERRCHVRSRRVGAQETGVVAVDVAARVGVRSAVRARRETRLSHRLDLAAAAAAAAAAFVVVVVFVVVMVVVVRASMY